MTTATVTAEQPAKTSVKAVVQEWLRHPLLSYYLVIAVGVMLACLGLLMVVSSSSVSAAVGYDDPYYYGKHQLFAAGIGLVGGVILSLVSDRFLEKMSWLFLALAIGLIILTFTPLGLDIGGNRNWLSLGPVLPQVQPSEFAKVALVVWGASDLSRRGQKLQDLRQWIIFLIGSFFIVGLVVLQKDLGTAVIIAAMVVVVMVAAGAPWRLLATVGALGLAAVSVLVIFQPNRMGRIGAFLNPGADPLGYDLQADHGLFALASGGWFGQGLGASRQKWGLLSEAHTDFIFAIIGEELGLIGTLTVIILFAALAYAGIRIALRTPSTFTRLAAIGVVAWFTIQAFVNIAVAVRAIPVMGVTLPMLSYGGSSLMANIFALGILAGCARREPGAQAVLAARKRKGQTRSFVRAAR
ncbi:MAG: putative lipid II flippase FtsW [Propionibacteriaceae bacterium]|jgi:cell division protein FtsW|nr:putative lipid II flippase FtsW [Propionibacteriaceae bacterium]